MKTSTGFINQCCNYKILRDLWLWAVPAMWYLLVTSRGSTQRQQQPFKKRKKSQPKPTQTKSQHPHPPPNITLRKVKGMMSFL